MPRKPKEHYVKNSDLVHEIQESLKINQPTDKLALMFMLIVKRYARKPCFNGYTYLDEMKANAVVALLENWHKFDLDFSITYPYFKKVNGKIKNYTEEQYNNLKNTSGISRRYPNPLSYYTTTIKNSFVRTLNKEKKSRDIKDALMVEAMSDEQYLVHFSNRDK